jgi:hypothetical protein
MSKFIGFRVEDDVFTDRITRNRPVSLAALAI